MWWENYLTQHLQAYKHFTKLDEQLPSATLVLDNVKNDQYTQNRIYCSPPTPPAWAALLEFQPRVIVFVGPWWQSIEEQRKQRLEEFLTKLCSRVRALLRTEHTKTQKRKSCGCQSGEWTRIWQVRNVKSMLRI